MRYTPAQMGRNDVEIVHVTTADGLRLEGWYRPAKDKTRRTIVLFHGNADYHQNAIHWMQPASGQGATGFWRWNIAAMQVTRASPPSRGCIKMEGRGSTG